MCSQRLKKGIPVKNSTEALANTILTKTIRTKEKVRKKTRGLWDTARQLKGLSDLLASPSGEPEAIPGKEVPLIKPTVKPADNPLEIKTEIAASSPTDQSPRKHKLNTAKSSTIRAIKSDDIIVRRNGRNPKAQNRLKIIAHKVNAAAESPENRTEDLADLSAREILNELKYIEKLIRERYYGSAIRHENQKG